MRSIALGLLLCLCFGLSGCSTLNQVEDLAFAEVMGVDINDQNDIEVCIEIPKISGQRDESSSGSSGGGSSQLFYTASGDSFDRALNLLQWAVPRRLDLSQIKLIVISESLAKDERFRQVANTIMATPRLYTAARFAVCRNGAKDFVSAEAPVIGTRLANELTATFEDYIRNGFIPDETFADMFYRSRSIYSDSLAIYAETAPESAASAPAAAIIPDGAQHPDIEMQHSNRYLGAAVFHKGQMVGKLDGEEFLYCKMLRGEQQTFPYSADGQTMGLTTMGLPDVSIRTDGDDVQIRIGLRFSIVSSSKSISVEKLKHALEDEFMETIEACKQMGAEPFNLAESASAGFLTLSDWEEFDWPSKFPESTIQIDVHISV